MSLEQTIDNLQIRNANMVTFVGTSNTMVDTTTGRIQTKGFQHNSNVITDVSGPHGRIGPTLKKYPEMIFEDEKVDRNDTTNTYTQAGYTISTDSVYGDRQVYKAFSTKGGEVSTTAHVWSSEDVGGNGYVLATGDPISGVTFQDENGTSYTGHYIKLELPKKIKLNSISFKSQKNTHNSTNNDKRPTSGTFLGSNDGTNWVLLKTFNEGELSWSGGLVPGATTDYVYSTSLNNIVSDGYFSYILFVIETIGNNNEYGPTEVRDLKYYGYEEDPPAGDHSVDTTFKSRFNNPQTTGVQVLVDGATGVGTNQISGGPDPSGNQSTYVTDGKYWTLNGTLTSNLSVEANTFLEGDQPHAVSVWFNSSNLEANVSNTCVFSIASEEKLDSVNLDLQSNTWHNLTYAYQGEGGSRVTYLDGRKVSEDQAEDTFREYPPFAMTGFSQGGYVVSASTEYTTYSAWNGFDEIQSASGIQNHWSGSSQKYSTSDGNFDPAETGSVYTTNVEGVNKYGEWLQIEFPHKIKYNYSRIKAPYDRAERQPRDGYIVGSNDLSGQWTTLHRFTGVTRSSGTETVTYTPSSAPANAFKYIRIVIEAITASAGRYAGVDEWDIYGHRENDLVRLPDPTNVLKYPHIIINEPAKRGYVVSSSTEAVPPSTTGSYQAYNIFDGGIVFDGGTSNTPPNGTAWISLSSKYDGSGNPTGTAASTNVTGQSPVATPGEWFQLELPHKVKLSSIRVMGQTNNTTELAGRSPVNAVLAGSNNGTTWTTVLTYTGASWTTLSEFKSFPANVDSTNAYKYFRFIITKTGGDQYAAIQEFEFYGTGVDSIPIQIGGGNIDKVANFRVYDRFIEEDQMNEIWNAQKDEFGRAKPQMVLQQGKLGIGTDAPQGSLSVADEPHNLEEFPPRAMTGYKTYFEGHGEFCVSASDEHSSNYDVQNAFNKITNRLNSSGGTTNTYYNGGEPTPRYYDVGNDHAYSGANSTHGLGDVMGEWVKLEFPYKANISQISILPVDIQISTLAPEDFTIMGSSDDINWTTLRTVTGATWTAHKFNEYTLPSTTSYKYFALVISRTVGSNQVSIQEVKYFGTREQGQSVLHDGQLTLTKSLNVPRIGPPLDADDTPRRDRLVVEYNTSTNPTFEGFVRDTSGMGNDGMFHGGASYSATEKALVFDGDADYVESPPLGWSGAQQHSVSVWIKLDQMTNPNSTSIQNAWTIVNGGAANRVSHLHIFTNGMIEWAFNGNNASTGTGQIEAGSWYHIVCVYNGGAGNGATSRRMWINGDEKSWNSLGSSSTLNLEPEATFALGYNKQLNNYDHDGSVSNAKLYDCALTAQEVETLYDMGRTGSVANPQPLHIAAPLYAPGSIVQVKSSLKTDNSSTSSTTEVDIAHLSVNILPKFSTSKMLVSYTVNVGSGNAHGFLRVKRTQGGVSTYIGDGYFTSGNRKACTSYIFSNLGQQCHSYSFEHLDDVNGTEPITYQVQFGVLASTTYTLYINRSGSDSNSAYYGRVSSSITVKEVCQ